MAKAFGAVSSGAPARLGGRLLRAFVDSLKEAFSHAERAHVNKTVVLSGFFKLSWLLPLAFCHDLFRVSAYYGAMQGNGSERVWLAVFGAFLALDLSAMVLRSFWPQVAALSSGAFLWPCMAVLIGSTAPHWGVIPAAPGAIIYMGVGICCWAGVIQRCVKHSADVVTASLERERDAAERQDVSRGHYIEIGNLLDAAIADVRRK